MSSLLLKSTDNDFLPIPKYANNMLSSGSLLLFFHGDKCLMGWPLTGSIVITSAPYKENSFPQKADAMSEDSSIIFNPSKICC